jgi:hypothetical protein
MSIQVSKIQIRKIPNIILFVCKLISEAEDGSADEMAKKIAEKINIELEKKDCFPTDHAYRTKVWNEFCARGIMMNSLLFIILSFICGYAFATVIVSLIYKIFKKIANFLKSFFVRQVKEHSEETSQENQA